jgi:hypothetical protein
MPSVEEFLKYHILKDKRLQQRDSKRQNTQLGTGKIISSHAFSDNFGKSASQTSALTIPHPGVCLMQSSSE